MPTRSQKPAAASQESFTCRLPPARRAAVPNDLEAFWVPFTPNRAFKKNAAADRAREGHALLSRSTAQAVMDGSAGMWCCNAGHNRDPIVAAIQQQAAELDYPPAFQFSHPKAFELASRIAALAPGDLDHVFFCNSGSEAVDTALKVALAYHNVRGEASRVRLIGRERGYHGVGFGGISVGGIVANRKMFGTAAGRRRSPAAHLQSRAAGLHQGRARMGRASRRRSRSPRRAARCLDHRGRDRRADVRLDRRAAAAEGLSRSGCARSATSTASC